MIPGSDHYVVDSKGKTIAVLLASAYPTEWSLQRKKQLYSKGQPDGRKIEIRARGEKA